MLTEIDVQSTLEKKLGVETAPYVILGACNPKLAHQALSKEPAIGLMLPCNVVLAQDGTLRFACRSHRAAGARCHRSGENGRQSRARHCDAASAAATVRGALVPRSRAREQLSTRCADKHPGASRWPSSCLGL